MIKSAPICMRFQETEVWRLNSAFIGFMVVLLYMFWSALLSSVSAQSPEPAFKQEMAAIAVEEEKPDGPPPRIPVLNYHSITVDPGNRATITPEKFADQMKYLSENGYTALKLQQFIDIIEGKKKAPAKPVLLTFDDGYADNYTQAMPVLKQYGFHATLFMSPGMVEDGYFLNWDQVKEMQRAGWDIQPHGMTHRYLNRLKPAEQEFQLTEARRQIEEQLGTTADIFCYPYGLWNQTTLDLLKKHGFRYAFTIEQGMTTHEQDKYKLKRIFVNGEENIDKWIYRLEKW